ncbi:MAG TPA: hypothetical protein VNV82_01360 [Bryobacteraceae bacterium]|nr:hypothetical protein [Bryobacteraceae bacterium]
MSEPGGALDLQCEFARGGELVDMTATPSQPAIEPIRNRGSVGHANIQGPARFENTAYFFQSAGKVVNMLKAVVGNHQVKATGSKRQAGRISLDKIGDSAGFSFQVKPDSGELPSG